MDTIAANPTSFAPDPEDMPAIRRLMRDELMALLGAEVRDIYDGSRIGGNELQRLAGLEAFQALARFQHRQRAEKALGIEFVVGHARHYSGPGIDLLCDGADRRISCRL